MTNTEKRDFLLRVDVDVYAKIKDLAIEDGRSVNNYIERVLLYTVREKEKKNSENAG